MPLISDTAYLYSVWGGLFKVHYGKLVKVDSRGNTINFRDLDTGKRYLCANSEGEVFNRVVWFKERNDNEAKKALSAYFLLIMNRQLDSMKKLKRTIDFLKGDPDVEE